MVNEAHLFMTGYVATEPTYWQNQEGRSKATMRVAYTPRRVNRDTGEWSDGPTTFVTVICWRHLADNVAMCLHKGDPVVVRGRMQVRRYEGKDGNDRIDVEVDASAIGHDMTRGVARFQRTRRGGRDTAPLGADAAREASMTAAAGMPGGASAMGDTDAMEDRDAAVAAQPAGAQAGPAGNPPHGDGEPAEGDEFDDVLDDRVVAALAGGDGGLGEEPPGE